jgi:hypothetical protein
VVWSDPPPDDLSAWSVVAATGVISAVLMVNQHLPWCSAR